MLAREIAKQHSLFIVPVTEGFVVYRRSPVPGARATRLGRRKDSSALLGFVRHLTGEVANAGR